MTPIHRLSLSRPYAVRGWGMVAGLLFSFTAVAQPPDCPSPDSATTWARDAVMSFSFAEADQNALLAEAGFGCAGPATPEQAARLHLVRAARYDFDGNIPMRDVYLASARSTHSTYYDDAFGPELRALWRVAEPSGSGDLRVPGLPPGWTVHIDGRVEHKTAGVLAGPHLIQIGPTKTETRWAKVVLVNAGGSVLVDIPSSALAPRAEPMPIPEPVLVAEPEPVRLPEPVVVVEPEPVRLPEPAVVVEPEPVRLPEPDVVAAPDPVISIVSKRSGKAVGDPTNMPVVVGSRKQAAWVASFGYEDGFAEAQASADSLQVVAPSNCTTPCQDAVGQFSDALRERGVNVVSSGGSHILTLTSVALSSSSNRPVSREFFAVKDGLLTPYVPTAGVAERCAEFEQNTGMIEGERLTMHGTVTSTDETATRWSYDGANPRRLEAWYGAMATTKGKKFSPNIGQYGGVVLLAYGVVGGIISSSSYAAGGGEFSSRAGSAKAFMVASGVAAATGTGMLLAGNMRKKKTRRIAEAAAASGASGELCDGPPKEVVFVGVDGQERGRSSVPYATAAADVIGRAADHYVVYVQRGDEPAPDTGGVVSPF